MLKTCLAVVCCLALPTKIEYDDQEVELGSLIDNWNSGWIDSPTSLQARLTEENGQSEKTSDAQFRGLYPDGYKAPKLSPYAKPVTPSRSVDIEVMTSPIHRVEQAIVDNELRTKHISPFEGFKTPFPDYKRSDPIEIKRGSTLRFGVELYNRKLVVDRLRNQRLPKPQKESE